MKFSENPGAWIAIFLVIGVPFIIFGGIVLKHRNDTADNTAERRIQRVTVDGQECLVLTQLGGKIIALDCDWSNR